ncbi:MAG: amidohydrolase family protein [Bacteriovoracaceae bacterium]|nr:amidohydrolase family protein [Bacteriovoracaceae bacterium]
MIIFLLLISFLKAETFVVDSYFDGKNVKRKGPFAITVSGSIITKITHENELRSNGHFLLPGLIDAHVHLFHENALPYNDHFKSLSATLNLSKTQRMQFIEENLNDRIKKGFLWLRDLGGDRFGAVALGSLLKAKRDFYPYVEMMGESLTWGTGQCRAPLKCNRIGLNIKNLSQEQILFHLLRIKKEGASQVKVYLDADPFESELMPPDILKFILSKSKLIKLKVAIHSALNYPYSQIWSYIDDNVSLEHLYNFQANDQNTTTSASIVPTDVPFSFIEFLKNRGDEFRFLYFDKIRTEKRFQELLKHKRRLCFGSDFYYETRDPVKTRGFWAIEGLIDWHEMGMPAIEVLRSATSNCANVFDGGEELTKVGEGQRANFIIVKGDPEKNIRDLHNVLWVIKAGKVLKRP